ncbi:polymorphic toxin type 44 domain-containing protein [Pseudomonas fulva]|uniref:polymorphic toxin type 44 domain-containing protein n=1 Tax=Pseudomonas fulva TaxID=47880 RepID=UPI001E3289A2|nr:polymorphic toxin type 44 domain-containing protein [Pseudomonas fulva]
MPRELPATVITDRRPDFSPLTVRPVVEPLDPQAQDTLDWLIRANEYVQDWMTQKENEINQQHNENLNALDAELDADILEAGGLNTTIDILTPINIVRNEKNVLIKLYMAKESTATEKNAIALRFASNHGFDPASAKPSSFVRAKGYKVVVDQKRLADWADSLQAVKLLQIYTEMAQRLRARVETLLAIESTQNIRAAEALSAAMEQIRLNQYPSPPPGVSLDQNLEESKAQKEHFKNGGTAFLLSWFYKKVRNRGEWDYKQLGPQFESFGNFNYGATGTASGISEAVLLRAAGAAQLVSGTSQADFDAWWAEAPYGDDPVDQAWIKAGIDYAKSKEH